MDRPIIDFKLDEKEDWTAILSCGHPQHTRHRPPFENRPWVISEEGRKSKLGQILNCVRCDEFELPTNFVQQSTSPEFTETSLPKAIQKDHVTKAGIWGKIVIIDGKLLYHVDSCGLRTELSAEKPGIIVPEVLHRVEAVQAVRFFIEFYGKLRLINR